MDSQYASLAFSEETKALQEKYGSRKAYARAGAHTAEEGLTEAEADFIGSCDSFYMATTGTNGFPYIQHRGGPKGFVKIFDKSTLGFLDFTGNKQYITLGNLATSKNVAIIMMHYPSRSRLKIYARTEVIELADRPDLIRTLHVDEYPARPERAFLLHVAAYDWNCPQHITPRYTLEEIEEVLTAQRDYIQKLEQALKAKEK